MSWPLFIIFGLLQGSDGLRGTFVGVTGTHLKSLHPSQSSHSGGGGSKVASLQCGKGGDNVTRLMQLAVGGDLITSPNRDASPPPFAKGEEKRAEADLTTSQPIFQ